MSHYKRTSERANVNVETLCAAVKEVALDKKSMRSVALAYKIPPKSFNRYVAKVKERIPDLSTADDIELMNVMKTCVGYHTLTV